MSLHLSLGETPAYLGVHSTAGPLPKDALENSLCASHCSSLKVFPGKRRMERRHQFPSLRCLRAGTASRPIFTHRGCPDSPRCCRIGSAHACLRSTSPRFWGRGCHIPSLCTERRHHRSSSSLPRVPMAPSFHEQASMGGHKPSD